MDDKIKSAVEIAMEKAAMLDDLSDEEKENIKNKKKIEPVMVDFYRNKLNPDSLWEKLKGKDESLLKMAQLNIIDSIKFGLDQEELKRRSNGIIALESLKKEQKTSEIQQGLNKIEDLQKNAENEKNQVFNELKKTIENNPQARTRVLEQGGAKVVMKISVEEAIAQNQQWKQFLLDFENNYGSEFNSIVENIRQYLS